MTNRLRALSIPGFVLLLSVLVSAAPAGPSTPASGGAKPSYFTVLWQLDGETRAGAPFLALHRSNYALVLSRNSSPNAAPLLEVFPETTLMKTESAFQLSFKVRLWRDLFGKNVDLWFGFTQRAFWQSYDVSESSPFRETDYEPEGLFNVRTRFRVLGLKARFIQFGYNHQSNGRSQPLSRTWDRLVLNAGLERGNLSLLLKTWYHIPHSYEQKKNPRIDDFMGPGEVWAYYFVKKHRLGIMLRDNLRVRGNRGAVELEWSFPLLRQVDGYVQGFVGYGESLLDHDHRLSRIGVGFILKDWD